MRLMMILVAVCLLAVCCSTRMECPIECINEGAAKFAAELKAKEHPCVVVPGDIWLYYPSKDNPFYKNHIRTKILEVSGKYALYQFCMGDDESYRCNDEPQSQEIQTLCSFYKKEEKKEVPK